MARPSKLSDKQWEEIGARLLSGESMGSLAKEFGVGKATISDRFAERNRTIRTIAERVVETEQAVLALPLKEQKVVRSLAQDMMDISHHVASAAKFGAATAHRLAGIANAKVQEVDDAKPLDDESREALKDIAVLTRMTNEAGDLAIKLMNANKDRIGRAMDAADIIDAQDIEVKNLPVLDAAKAYQDFISS